MTERGMVQMPVYFVSRALQGPKLNYTPIEKLVLSLVFAAKRLKRYFQAHHITVITDQPIKQIMSRPDVVGRLQKWSIMLGEYNNTYWLRTSVKGQVLANFLAEMPDETSNNEAEYEALIAGLRITTQMGVQNIHVSVDSKLVPNQVLGAYVAKEENMIKYLEKVKRLVSGFTNFSLNQELQSKNKKADALSKIASTSFAHLSKQGIDIAGPFPKGPVIPAEIGMPTYRTVAVDIVHNDEELNLDLLEERRERAAIRVAKANNDASHAVDGGKLGPKWEGPYEITKALGDGAYKLRSANGTVLPRT
nr:reverse transcriptase domain-containing protein [Tanacetum cinerariifolium]